MEYKVMVPSQIWQGYDPRLEPLKAVKTDYVGTLADGVSEERYQFTALTVEDGDVRVAVRVISATGTNDLSPVILVVSEYHKEPDIALVAKLAEAGYVVVIPDISAIAELKTIFPPSLEYGEYAKAGDHIRKVMPTAKETSQYLYAKIVKRTIIFIKRTIGDGKLIAMGLGDAVEVAMQVVGTGGEADGLACINGAGYREYIKHSRYGSERELVMDEERMCWLTGIASVAYAKFIKVPTFIAIGSNASKSDIDRLSNLKALMGTDEVHISISPRASDFMLPEAYNTLIIWLKSLINGEKMPDMPTMSIQVGDDGIPSFSVNCDAGAMIKKVTVYYAVKEYQHEIRDWREADCVSASSTEYIAQAEDYDEKEPLFAYAVVEYIMGVALSTTVEFADLKGYPVHPREKSHKSRVAVVYQAGEEESGFVADYDGTVLFEPSLKLISTPKGAVGLTSECGGLRTYRFDPEDLTTNDRILNIELYSSSYTEADVILIGAGKEGSATYTAKIRLNNTKGLFMGTQLRLTDFKDESNIPPHSWVGIKVLAIRGQGVAIGNILFI